MPAFTTTLMLPDEPLYVQPRTIQLRPTKMFMMPAGSTENKLTFCFELSTKTEPVVYAQISLKMLMDSFTPEHKGFLKRQIAEYFEEEI